MPNVVGEQLWAGIALLQKTGVINQGLLGYFLPFPVTVKWTATPGKSEPPDNVISAQSIASGTDVAPNAALTLSVSGLPMGVVFP